MRLANTLGAIGLIVCVLTAMAVADQDPDDPGEADSVLIRPYAVVVAGPPWPDSIGVPIEIWADDTIGGYGLGFTVDGPGSQYFIVSSVDHDGPCVPAAFNTPPTIITHPDTNSVYFGWIDFTGVNLCVSPQAHLATIYLQVDPNAPPGTTANLDSTWVYPAGDFVFVLKAGSSHAFIKPAFNNGSQHGFPNILLGEIMCGDADGSGSINISDAVFLIQYIFAGGSAPNPLEAGDADCSGGINMSDVVYLIQYIFAEGPDPCDPNDDGVPDC